MSWSSSKAPCLQHHRIREGYFKMEKLPSEIVSSTFSYLSTTELGQMTNVCKGWEEVLSINPSLWRHIDLATPKHTLKIIEVFARRSRNTLISIKSSARFTHQEARKMITLLELSKRTLRAVDLMLGEHDFDETDLPSIRRIDGELCEGTVDNSGPHINAIQFFQSFPKLERSSLIGDQLPEIEADVPGTLTVFGYDDARGTIMKEADSEWLSGLKAASLWFDVYDGDEVTLILSRILAACRSTLLHLQVYGSYEEDLPPIYFPHLSFLIDSSSMLLFKMIKAPSLKHVTSSLGLLLKLLPNGLETFNIMFCGKKK